ncbi:MAG: HAD family hydrolase, partial [Pseudomonas graminis]
MLNHLSQCGLISLEHDPVYLKVSRTVLLRSQLGEDLGWELGLDNKFEGSVLDLLIKRYGLKLYEAFNAVPAEVLGFPVSLPRDSEMLKEWMAPHAPKLKEVVLSTRNALASYLKKLDLSSGPNPMMLDLGYAGTIQKILTQLLDRDTAGLYFIATDASDKKIGKNTASMAGVFKENVKWQEGYILLERSLLLESLMTA